MEPNRHATGCDLMLEDNIDDMVNGFRVSSVIGQFVAEHPDAMVMFQRGDAVPVGA